MWASIILQNGALELSDQVSEIHEGMEIGSASHSISFVIVFHTWSSGHSSAISVSNCLYLSVSSAFPSLFVALFMSSKANLQHSIRCCNHLYDETQEFAARAWNQWKNGRKARSTPANKTMGTCNGK